MRIITTLLPIFRSNISVFLLNILLKVKSSLSNQQFEQRKDGILLYSNFITKSVAAGNRIEGQVEEIPQFE